MEKKFLDSFTYERACIALRILVETIVVPIRAWKFEGWNM